MLQKISDGISSGFSRISSIVRDHPFRALGSNYNKFAENKVFGQITIKEGERAAIWSRNGKLDIITGPNQRFCKLESVQFLEKYVADPSQYLEVVMLNGENEYLSGPTQCWVEPDKYNEITLRHKSKIATNEAMICYKTDKNGVTKREILRGPMLYSPTSVSEWMHSFRWHFPEQVKENKGLTQSGVLYFTTIRLLPDHMYFDIPNVRTKDDALIKFKCMIFFTITDLEKMLDSTHDPINVMINGMIADVMQLSANKELDHFKENCEELSKLQTYPELTVRAENIGYAITKVVFRGFESDADLQEMHDNAIKKRTEIKLQKEAEKAKQELEALILNAKIERNEYEMQLKHDKHKQEIKIMKQKQEEELKHLESINDEKMRYYKYMKNDLNCNVADIMRAESEKTSNTKIIRIDGNAANIHHHIDDNADVIAKSTQYSDDEY